MKKYALLAAVAGIFFSTSAANALPLRLPILGALASTPHTLPPGNPVTTVVAETAGIVQVVVDPLASHSGGNLSPLVSLNEAHLAHVFAVFTGGGDLFHPDPSDIFAIDPNLEIGADVSTLTFITGDLFSPANDPNALLLLTNVTQITANIDLSGLGVLPDISAGINPLELCLSLAIGGNAAACAALIDPNPTGVPEPASMALLGAGLASVSLMRFARRRKSAH